MKKATDLRSLMLQHGIKTIGETEYPIVPRVSSGSFKLDKLLGGGWPLGIIAEVYGIESSGKTSLALLAVREFQKVGYKPVYIDVENTMDTDWATRIGVDVGPLYKPTPDCAENTLDLLNVLVKIKDNIGLIVVDSVGALVPRAEAEGNSGDANMGLLARLMTQGLRKVNPYIKDSGITILFINHVYNSMSSYGNSLATPGGFGLKFYSSIRLQTLTPEKNKHEGEVAGVTLKVKNTKNKTSKPYLECEIYLNTDTTFSHASELLDLMLDSFLITKSSSYYTIPTAENIVQLGKNKSLILDEITNDTNKKIQGRNNVIGFFNDNPVLIDACVKLLKIRGVI